MITPAEDWREEITIWQPSPANTFERGGEDREIGGGHGDGMTFVNPGYNWRLVRPKRAPAELRACVSP
jgi:hypothetical protein